MDYMNQMEKSDTSALFKVELDIDKILNKNKQDES